MTRRPIAGERSRSRLTVPAQPSPPAPHVESPADRSRSFRARSVRVLACATVLLLVLATTAILLTVRAQRVQAVEQARRQAQAAAEAHAVSVLSYDHRHLDRDFRRARAVLTGAFAEKYERTTEKVVRPTAEQVKAVVSASVAASSVVRADADRVVVLLFVDQTTTSTRLDGPKVDLTRVRMTLDRVAAGGPDRWLVSRIDAL
jgi:Mce-associated membrane protein